MGSSMAGAPRTSVLFVCLGNICRSPMAEGVFRHLVHEAGLDSFFHIGSAGTGAWHVGQPPDPRSSEAAALHGIALDGEARQVEPADLDRFDHVIAMDRENLEDLQQMLDTTGGRASLHLMRDFDPEAPGADVPDPYYEGARGFETVYAMVRRSCEGLLDYLRPPQEAS